MDFTESIINLIEDTVADALYDNYSEDAVNKFLKNLGDDVASSKMLDLIDELHLLVTEKIDELVSTLEDELDGEDEEDYDR